MSDLVRALVADLGPRDLGELMQDLVEHAPDVGVAALADRLRPHMQGRAAGEWTSTTDAGIYLGLPSSGSLHKIVRAGAIPYHQDVPNGKLWFRRSDLDAYRAAIDSDGAGWPARPPVAIWRMLSERNDESPASMGLS